MKLESNEFTTQGLIKHLNENFKKPSGEQFNQSDVAQYCNRGYLPYRYGGQLLTLCKDQGVKIITIKQGEDKTK